MSGTVADILAVAKRNVGFIEGPNNDNPYAAVAGHPNHQPWCASFVVACAKRAGVHLPSYSAYTPAMAQGFKNAGRWHTGGAQVGDIVFFQWPGMGRIAHVGIVRSVGPDGSLETYEGNTDVKGGRTGGRVMVQVRRANIAGFGRPAYYPPAKKATSTAFPVISLGSKDMKHVVDLQTALVKHAFLKRADVDGIFGRGTLAALKAFQKATGLVQSGKTDAPTVAALRKGKAR